MDRETETKTQKGKERVVQNGRNMAMAKKRKVSKGLTAIVMSE